MKTLTKLYWLRFALGITAAFLCIGYGFVTGTISTNLVLNRSVEGETLLQNWFASGNGTLWSTAYARTGSRSLEINVTNDSGEWTGNAKPVNSETTYQIQGFFKGEISAQDQFYLAIKWFSDSSLLGENNVSTPAGNYSIWLPLGGEFTSPKNAKSCQIVFKAVNGTGVVYGDDFEVRQTESITRLLNGISVSIITYLVSYYILKFALVNSLEKPRKLFTTGIGIYFLVWIVSWILLYTLVGAFL